MLELPFLMDCAPMQTFLTRTQTFEEAMKEINRNAGISTMTKVKKMVPAAVATFSEDGLEVMNRYRELFPDVMEAKLSEKAEAEVQNLQEFLKSSEDKLQGLVTSCRSLATHVDSVCSDLTQLNVFLEQLYTTEEGYPECPAPPRINIRREMEAWQVATAKTTATYKDDLLQVFVSELEDVQVFLDMLRRRDIVLIRFTKQNKKAEKWRHADADCSTDKARAQRTADLAKEQEERDLLDLHTKMLLGMQVTSFWEKKTADFKKAFHNFAQNQMEYSNTMVATWETAVEAIARGPAAAAV